MCIVSANIDFDWYHCQLIEWHWYSDLSASVPLCHIIFCCLNVKHVVMKAEKDKAIRKTLALPDGYFKDLKLDKIDHPQCDGTVLHPDPNWRLYFTVKYSLMLKSHCRVFDFLLMCCRCRARSDVGFSAFPTCPINGTVPQGSSNVRSVKGSLLEMLNYWCLFFFSASTPGQDDWNGTQRTTPGKAPPPSRGGKTTYREHPYRQYWSGLATLSVALTSACLPRQLSL